MVRIEEFFCGLHSYVQMAEVTEAALTVLEKELGEEKLSDGSDLEVDADAEYQEAVDRSEDGFDFRTKNENESGAVRLERTVCKLFAVGADLQSGCSEDLSHYDMVQKKLEEAGKKKVPLEKFRGNRFNVIFFNGTYVYYLHEELTQFLRERKDKNRLMKSVLTDLNVKGNIAGCKVLGLISKQITGHLWRVLENDEIGIN